ncbi:Glycosyl transferases group 1 [Bryocella elongata]|uniref:Glycosyl transferases group 1 n=1 Tax=Bryocella elongata TaxID=863522 RepID=A0A1H6BIK1_9BACT|nr:glycosyltransferase [Bryocella elongata]SEG60550.1 Glycosyl transferases group 1 [Bryocella elongata]
MSGRTYLMVLPVEHYRLDANHVALESAFAEHLLLLRDRAAALGLRLVVAMRPMSAVAYEQAGSSLATHDAAATGIEVITLESASGSFGKTLNTLRAASAQAAVVHTGLSFAIRHPTEFAAWLMGWARGRVTIFVVDIDFRGEGRMDGSACAKPSVFQRFLLMQLRLAVSLCSVVLLKGQRFAAEYAKGRTNVHSFLDAAHSAEYLLPGDALAAKVASHDDRTRPLELVYFGRFVERKGIAEMLRTLAATRARGVDAELHLYGSGPQRGELMALAAELEIVEHVLWHEPIPYGPELFAAVAKHHLLLGMPLTPDTPRNAIDAMAVGVPFLAFDTEYYRELAASGAGSCTAWPDVDQAAARLAELDADRPRLKAMATAAHAFAVANTQESWVARRDAWTRGALQQRGLLR